MGKRHRSNNSSQSDLDVSPSKSKKKTRKSKKIKKMAAKMNETIEENETLSKKIDEINLKLNNILTKDDTGFIKTMIKETLDEMKEKIISSVMLRVEKLEGEMHDIAVKNTALKKDLESSTKENTELKNQIKKEVDKRTETVNELEQYGRRNNIRISGISYDAENESAHETTDGVLRLLNENLEMNVGYQDIDIAHRLGKYKPNIKRSVIVKFIHRHVKASVMSNAKKLKNTNIFINEDLTYLNQTVLASLRLKAKDRVAKCWSFEGKIYVKYKNDVTEQVKYKNYATWLALDWPKSTAEMNENSD